MAAALETAQVRRALAHPTIGPQLGRLGVKVRDTLAGGGYVICPRGQEDLAAELVELAHEDEWGKLPEERAPLPAGLGWFAWSKIQKAVIAFEQGKGRNEVFETVGLPPQDTTRVHRMWAHGLLRLSASGKLKVDPRIARRGGRSLALRYWNGERWLDPFKCLS
jgi:hypothetical protein